MCDKMVQDIKGSLDDTFRYMSRKALERLGDNESKVYALGYLHGIQAAEKAVSSLMFVMNHKFEVANTPEVMPGLKSTKHIWSVFVGGAEVNDLYMTEEDAIRLANEFIKDGYDDVALSNIHGKEILMKG